MDGGHEERTDGLEAVAPSGVTPTVDLSASAIFESAARAWVPVMRSQAGGDATTVTVFRRRPEGGAPFFVAGAPEGRLADADEVGAAERALRECRGVVRGGDAGGLAGLKASRVAIAVPLILDDVAEAAAVVSTTVDDEAGLRDMMRHVQWGAGGLSDALRREALEAERRNFRTVGHALHTLVAAASEQEFHAACQASVTDLATRFDCDRVSIGFRRFRRSRVQAISHTAEFTRRMTLIRLLGQTMDEAVDQRSVTLHPQPDDEPPLATGAAQALAREHGAVNVLTVPLYAMDRFVGAVVFERPSHAPFTGEEVETLEAAVTTLAPILEEKRQNDRWLITKVFAAGGRQVSRLLGPGRVMRKLIVIAALAALAFFALATSMFTVDADASVEGRVLRAAVAPFDGFIADAPVRAGARVAEGDILVRLDDRDLALERLRRTTELQRRQLEYEQAIAARDRAEAAIVQTQIDQSRAQIELLDAQIERAAIRAPFDGLVVAGDLSQSLGAAVGRGQVLFEVSPLDAYRIAIEVDERRIADVEPGQTGSLRVTALPEETFPIRIESISPVAEYGEGATTFRVEAEVTGDTGRLRPGMEGAAKIEVAERLLIDNWTLAARDWLRLALWRWVDW